MKALLIPATQQGRTVETMNLNWVAYVPTVDQFRDIFGAVFQTKMLTDAPAFASLTLDNTKWFLTSTESDQPGHFWAINYKGELKAVTPEGEVSIHLLFENTVI